MNIDKKEIRKRCMLYLVASPVTVLPILTGITLLYGAWALELEFFALVAFIALCFILGGAGLFATRFMLFGESTARKIVKEIQDELDAEREKALDLLEEKLSTDGDERTEKYLRDLRTLAASFKQNNSGNNSLSSTYGAFSALEMSAKVDELFTKSVSSLEKTYELWSAANGFEVAAAKKPILAERENLIDEVRQTIEQLGQSFADLQQLKVGGVNKAELAKVRNDLSEHMTMMNQVEEEVESWKVSMGTGTKHAYDDEEFLQAFAEEEEQGAQPAMDVSDTE